MKDRYSSKNWNESEGFIFTDLSELKVGLVDTTNSLYLHLSDGIDRKRKKTCF